MFVISLAKAIPEAIPLKDIKSSHNWSADAKSFLITFFPINLRLASATEVNNFLKSSIFAHQLVW